ncbi:NlpC/P60 family peptidoglycan-binding protein RipD [Mycobacterium sp.]|jgi:cell wall-associated NlpC family hydrolase|uniref:NlpC/P60 family peptidoglycan-binding protein RipD n=1 Tax=Mycobacterium sp. TaxID=1785 RepID=UPI003340D8B1|nr:cell wall-associated hydrolase, invasion-associated protein [Mycobacterium sp.]
MRRICAVMIALALLGATPGIATADSTRQQAINAVIARALAQRGVPYAYGGGNAAGPSLGTASVNPVGAADARLGADPLSSNVAVAGLSPLGSPVVEPRVSRVGFDSSGLVLYAFAGVGIKMPRSSGEQYKVGRKIPPSQALPGDLIFYGPEGSQSVALFVGNGQMVEATDPAVTVSPVRTNGMTPYLTRIIES